MKRPRARRVALADTEPQIIRPLVKIDTLCVRKIGSLISEKWGSKQRSTNSDRASGLNKIDHHAPKIQSQVLEVESDKLRIETHNEA